MRSLKRIIMRRLSVQECMVAGAMGLAISVSSRSLAVESGGRHSTTRHIGNQWY
jgi:hypothetical protein